MLTNLCRPSAALSQYFRLKVRDKWLSNYKVSSFGAVRGVLQQNVKDITGDRSREILERWRS
jgi:hypothetical protein